MDTPDPAPTSAHDIDIDRWPTVIEVARALDVSKGRVHALDSKLNPRRDRQGYRRYDPARLAVYVVEREARRARYRAATTPSTDGTAQTANNAR